MVDPWPTTILHVFIRYKAIWIYKGIRQLHKVNDLGCWAVHKL